MQVYGAGKAWRQLAREGASVVRCTVERMTRRGAARRDAQRGGEDQVQRWQSAVSSGSGQLAIPSAVTEPVLGLRLQLQVDLAGRLAVCRLRDRRLCPAHCGLAGQQFDAHGLRARYVGASAV